MTEAPRQRLSDTRLVLYALIALVIVIVAVVTFGPNFDAPALSVRSSHPDGAMALKMWLEQSGYPVRELATKPLRPGLAHVLFLLNPLEPYTPDEAQMVRDWVRRGGLLIVGGRPSMTQTLLDVFNVHISSLYSEAQTISQAAPVLKAPPVDTMRAEPMYRVTISRPDAVVYAYEKDDPLLISFREGTGTVWVTGLLRPFTNRGLRDKNNASLVINILAGQNSQDLIAFDESRHFFGETPSVQAWLFNTPPGWGVLLALAISMAFLALRGRRFGQPVPLPEERLQRDPVEYIQAIANLYRRAGQRTEMFSHYRGQLRRRLSERYTVDPRLDDVELVKTIVFRDPSVDEADLRDVLARLSRKSVSEQDLVRVATDVDRWLHRLK